MVVLNFTDPDLECACLGNRGLWASTLRYVTKLVSLRCFFYCCVFGLGTGGKSLLLALTLRIALMAASISPMMFEGG